MKKKIGVIVPDDGAFPLEIIDEKAVNKWISEETISNADYVSFLTPGDVSGLESSTEYDWCEYWAREDILVAAACHLGNAGCHSVVFGCTSASSFKGMNHARRLIQLLSESAGVPASSTSMAFLAALDLNGTKKVDILSVYSPDVTQRLISFLAEAGIGVGNVRLVRCSPEERAFNINCEANLAEFVSLTTPSDDPILIPCTSIKSLNRIESFERSSGRQVITANQVTLWHALVLAGFTPNIPGSFFKSFSYTADSALHLPL
ncbi:MAG: hypothetical protein EOR25_34045 [Mesorhizobium sp.]|uniref:maleate cis-trans isomerase family protein n=1 Tax=Mesorhizobium sp. TaxID=1871066 RepID=UPI000FE43EEC|nr:hypothetical protein [Mesorhizobium sp.]RWJ01920.1 MAG: hypothetical protein EOR24_35335 [Mesorhizobium sp.]RWJ09766.1 MAG: hypothetical protein EOR25_34045 [Mesorhizobium sp.]RWJ74009.1 MAG: hypothetical protein EOR35_32135 [Mesorhizobium sp.]